jgi:replicative DNA helicase
MTDRIKPHNPTAEQRILGCMLLKFAALQEVLAEYPKAEDLFYDDRHGAIFAAMRDANTNDPAAISELLRNRQQEVGGISYISSLANEAASGTIDEVRHFAALLVRDYVRRRLIEAAAGMESDAYDSEDAAAALENAERSIMEIGASLQSDSDPDMASLVQAVLGELEEAFNNKGIIRGLSVGFNDFDWMTHGLKAGQMIVLAARPGVGKTSLAMNMVEHVAVTQKYPVGVFSLEMTATELIHRMACSRARIDSKRAQEGNLQEGDLPRLQSALTDIRRAPLHICEKGGLTILQLGARARRMHQRHKLKLLVIDYMQLMQSRSRGNRNEQITEISNGVKALAKDLRIPIVVLSQLNRDVDKNDREPRLSDLRDSGSIEQDADLVMLLSPKPMEEDADTQIVDALIPKHRGGPVGLVHLVFLPSLTRFESRAKTADVPTHWQDK